MLKSTESEKGISWKSQFKAQNRFTIYKNLQILSSVQSKLVVNLCSLFVNLLGAMLLTGSVNCVLYDRDSFSRH